MIRSLITSFNTISHYESIINPRLLFINQCCRFSTTTTTFINSKNNSNSNDNDNSDDITQPFMNNLEDKKERIQKYLARCGVASRRSSEEMIKSGRVTINDKVVKIGENLLVGVKDTVKVDNMLIKASIPKLWLHHKPRNTLVTTKDSFGRDCLVDILQKVMNKPHIIPVGRLDYYSEGLILFTNDGELSRYLENPKTEITRTYRVRIFGHLTEKMKEMLHRGIVVDNIKYKSIKAEIESETESNSWIKLTLTEGKNREIRNILEYFNIKVLRLVRLQFGPYEMPSTLKPGEVVEAQIKGDLKQFVNKWSKEQRVRDRLNK